MILKSAKVARLLNQSVETVREMVRTRAVGWGVYLPPKHRHGRGKYIYYAEKTATSWGSALM